MDPAVLPVPVVVYTVLNIWAFVIFARDKLRAQRKGARTPENTLLIIAALGPLGALTAIIVLRHKTRHLKFLLVPVFLVLHLLFLGWLWLQIAR
jgi:uncharacterized membrane protein YsdA (DUF1294 family)